MNRLLAAATTVLLTAFLSVTVSGAAGAADPLWSSSVPFANVVASSPTTGGGYPVPPGSRVPTAGTCRSGPFNANHSESWLAVKPGTEDLVGTSKFFFDQYSTFYMFYNGAYQIPGGTPAGNNQVQGYDCISTGTQAMPPSWTNTTDPNADFDTKGRVYQTMLAYNSFFDATKLHPDGEIDLSYSDDLGRHWVKGNGGKPLEPSNNASAKQAGHVEDKQWIAVNHIAGNRFQDHVYAAWAVFNGNGGGIKVRMAVSRDRGATFGKAVTIAPPSQVSAGATYVYPTIDAAGNVYVSVVSFPPNGSVSTIYVARSTDDARTFSSFVPITTVNAVPGGVLPNTRFRDGITESFAASPTFPGHLYLTYEDWDSDVGKMNVKFTQSTDGGATLDDADHRQRRRRPSRRAHRPVPAVDRRGSQRRGRNRVLRPAPGLPERPERATRRCRTDELLHRHVAAGVQGQRQRRGTRRTNERISQFTWDPEQPGQHLGGLSQYPCAGATDPCNDGFIGDYFGLAISASTIYALMVSTHYPSNVTADEGGPIYYQQQVLAKVPRLGFRASY